MSKYFNIKKAASVSTIYMYGDIGYEVASGQIAAELAACAEESERIDIRINSNGGDVFSGIASTTPSARAMQTYVFTWTVWRRAWRA